MQKLAKFLTVGTMLALALMLAGCQGTAAPADEKEGAKTEEMKDDMKHEGEDHDHEGEKKEMKDGEKTEEAAK